MSSPAWPARYEIRVDGILDDRWADWFGGLEVKSEGTQTAIVGPMDDQPALHGGSGQDPRPRAVPDLGAAARAR